MMTTPGKESVLTPGLIRRLVSYDKSTGQLTWLPRSPEMFEEGKYSAARKAATWNAVHAGKTAGCVGPDGYRRVAVNGFVYLAHRLAWVYVLGEWPSGEIDHRDGVGSNNKWRNLRLATKSQNRANVSKRKTNKLGFKGVYWHDRVGKFYASIRVNKVSLHLGTFDRVEDAHAAYVIAAEKHFGEFARMG